MLSSHSPWSIEVLGAQNRGWKPAVGTWSRFVAEERRDGPKTFNSLVTDGLDGLVQKAHVHDTLARHVRYHSLCFPDKPCPDCGISLAARPQPHLHRAQPHTEQNPANHGDAAAG
jgi:hypothetical protein